MAFGKNKVKIPAVDDTAWILDNGFAEFVLMHTSEIVSIPIVSSAIIVRILVPNSTDSHLLLKC